MIVNSRRTDLFLCHWHFGHLSSCTGTRSFNPICECHFRLHLSNIRPSPFLSFLSSSVFVRPLPSLPVLSSPNSSSSILIRPQQPHPSFPTFFFWFLVTCHELKTLMTFAFDLSRWLLFEFG